MTKVIRAKTLVSSHITYFKMKNNRKIFSQFQDATYYIYIAGEAKFPKQIKLQASVVSYFQFKPTCSSVSDSGIIEFYCVRECSLVLSTKFFSRMCIAVFIWQSHPLYPFLLLLNRDEYHNRPTKPVAWWEDGEILGGRDEVAGGTWLACSKTGRVAFLTNVLELHVLPEAKSRGDLPVRFLQSGKSPKAFAQLLVEEAHQYNGFNLIIADSQSKSMVYVSNRPKGSPILIQEVHPGIHVLSNAKLDSPWPKAQRLKLNFKMLLGKYGFNDNIPVKEMVERLMRDKIKADKSKLPHICSLDWEFNLSSIFVEVDTPLGRYGTRSTAVVTVNDDDEISFYEIYLESNKWKDKKINFHIHNLQ